MGDGLPQLYEAAFTALEQAVHFDKKDDRDKPPHQQVLPLYEKALALFGQVKEQEPDVAKRNIVVSKMQEYQKRVKEIKEGLGDHAFARAEKENGGAAALAPYLEAVEMYLAVLKLDGGGGEGAVDHDAKLRGRVKDILDRVEILKGGKTPQLPLPPLPPSPAGVSSISSSHASLAFDLPLAPTTPLPHVSSTSTSTAATTSSAGTPSQLPLPPLPLPSTPSAKPPTGDLTAAELEVLRDSSIINGRTFLPWLEGEEQREQFNYSTPFKDPEGVLPLSAKQASRLGGWKRPHEFIKASDGKPCMIKAISPFSIEQDLVADCSFVASLCICAAFEQKYKTQLITKTIYPQVNGVPVYNPSGKYMVKLWANGCLRKVVVDDLLPVGRDGDLLCSSSSDRTELWVSIVEKAFMKLNGSYDFPGSNSGIDMYTLTGWIPEQIYWDDDGSRSGGGNGGGRGGDGGRGPVLDHRQPAERAWSRLRSASQFGDCLTTVATSSLGEAEAESLGLVPSHAYAVLSVKEVLGGKKFLLLKNPWRRKSWKGPYCANDTVRWTPELSQALGYDARAAQRSDDGVFWISWDDVRRFFSSVFLNWRPGLFTYKTVLHNLWPREQGPPNDTFSYGQNPQYLLDMVDNKKATSVWILLSRHVTSRQEAMEGGSGGDFLTVHVFRNNVDATGRSRSLSSSSGGSNGSSRSGRVIYPTEDALYRGIYSNNPHGLVRLDIDPGEPTSFALVLSQYEKKRDVRYSLTVLSTTVSFRLRPTPPLPPVVSRLEGSWTAESAGGRLGLSTFLQNPQFLVVLKTPTFLHIELLAPKEYFAGFSLLGGARGGKRVDSILQGEEVLTSGAYRQGFCYADGEELKPGAYTLVVSTYEPGLKGNFVVNIHSPQPLHQTSILLPEGDGMIKKIITGAWEAPRLTGGCAPPGYVNANPTFLISCNERTHLFMRLYAEQHSEPINVTLYRTNGGGNGGQLLSPFSTFPGCDLSLITSHNAIYTASRCGVTTPTADLTTGQFVLIVSCYNPGVESAFTLTLYTSSRTMDVKRIL